VILDEEFLEPLGLSAYALAKAVGVRRNRITGVLHGARAVSADTAPRLARFFGTSARFWLGLQMDHDLEQTGRAADRYASRRRSRVAGRCGAAYLGGSAKEAIGSRG
jgi:antitoxin HigA-1